MVTKTKLIFFGILALLGAGIIIFCHSERSSDLSDQPVPAGKVAEVSPSASRSFFDAPSNNSISPSHLTLPKPHAILLQRYNAGSQMRALLHTAMQQPGNGGYMYATKILQQCQGIVSGTLINQLSGEQYRPGEDVEKFAKSQKAAEYLRSRCADFTAEETENSRSRNIWIDGASKDPLIQAADRFGRSFENFQKDRSKNSEINEALKAVVDLGDPLLVDDLGMRLPLSAENGKKGFLLDGKFYDLNSDTDIGAALYLLPCGLGLQCDEREFDVSLRCATGGDCDTGRFQHVEKMMQSQPGAYSRVVAVYESMRRAFLSGNAGYFFKR